MIPRSEIPGHPETVQNARGLLVIPPAFLVRPRAFYEVPHVQHQLHFPRLEDLHAFAQSLVRSVQIKTAGLIPDNAHLQLPGLGRPGRNPNENRKKHECENPLKKHEESP